MSGSDHVAFSDLNTALKAAGEATRLRILALLAEAELTVSDLTDILRQSQPRISRHLRLLAEAGLVDRYREGAWAFFRLAEQGQAALAIRSLVARLDAAVEATIRAALGDKPMRTLLDLGTGTGRMLELFAGDIERGLGLDLSRDMLALARARLDRAGFKHCSVRHGDIYDLAVPRDSFDVVIIHQVLHFLDDSARAIREAARVLRPGGRLLIVDFAPHDLEFLRDEHAHRRLGFAAETVTQWLEAAGLDIVREQTLPPEPQGKIAVSLWLARDPRVALAEPATTLEVA